jgi:hypothetical protein
MAYDRDLAERIRSVVASKKGFSERAMFGGLAFLLNGNMAVAASGQGGLLLRCDPEDTEAHVQEPHVDRMEMRGRKMNGWLRVETDDMDDAEMARWIAVGVTYAGSLPPK